MLRPFLVVAGFIVAVLAHGDHDHDQEPVEGPHNGLWYNTLPGDGGTQVRTRCIRQLRARISFLTP